MNSPLGGQVGGGEKHFAAGGCSFPENRVQRAGLHNPIQRLEFLPQMADEGGMLERFAGDVPDEVGGGIALAGPMNFLSQPVGQWLVLGAGKHCVEVAEVLLRLLEELSRVEVPQ